MLLLAASVTLLGGVMAPATASAATVQADCSALLRPQTWSWSAQCIAPHQVTVRTEIWWNWLGDPRLQYSTRDRSKQVQPGTTWNDAIVVAPELRVHQLCMTAFQDTTLLIAPRVCAYWPR